MRLVSAKVALMLSILQFAVPILASLPALAQVELVDEPEIAGVLKLPIIKWEDKDVRTDGVILALHGLTLHAKTFDTTARFLSSKGYPTYAIDLRGMGKWLTEPDRFEGKRTMDFSLCKSDVIRTLRSLRETYPDKPIFCMGESYGATLSAYVATKEPALVDGIILSSFCDKRLWKHPMFQMIPDMVRGFSMPFIAVSLRPYTSKLLSPDPLVTQAYLQDPLIIRRITATRLVKTLVENKRVIHKLSEIQVPTLVLSGGKDGTRQRDVMPKILKKICFHQLQFHSMRKQGHLLLECQPKMHRETAATLEQWLVTESSKQMAHGPGLESREQSLDPSPELN